MLSYSHLIRANENSVTVEEPKLRAAIVLGIIRFSRWPDEKSINQTFEICVAGNPLSENTLINLSQKKKIKKLPIVVRSIDDLSTEILKCKVLVVGPELPPFIINIPVDTEPYQGVLTICDDCGEYKDKLMINLVRIQKRIGFEVNLDLALKNGMKLKSALLELAIGVKQN